MTEYSKWGVLLLIAISLSCGAVSAVHAQANLELTKTLFNTGTISAGDQIIWNITLKNIGADTISGLEVTDDKAGLGDFTLDKAEASDGTFVNFKWNPGSLGAGGSATLNLTMTIAANAPAGQLKNCVSVTGPIDEITGPVCASATIEAGAADLVLTKTLFNTGSIFAGDQVIWNITLTNQGTSGVTGIVVTEDPSGLGDFTPDKAEASGSTSYNDATNEWTIGSLAGGASATLNLTMTLAKDAVAGELKNCVEITSSTPAQANSEPVCTSGETSPTVKLDVTIKPETLNLKSRGVFTAFIRLAGDVSQEGITLKDISSITCGGAESTKVKITQKDGGTLMGKFRRQSLGKDVVAGDAVEIMCDGTVTIGGETVKVTGSDTVRVIGEKKTGLDAFFSGILDTIAPVDEVGEGTDETTTTPTASPAVTPDQSQNRGQLKKAERNSDTGCTGDCAAGDSQTIKGNGKKSNTDDGDNQVDSHGNGNQGNGNGKGNNNKQDKDKGNGKNKN